MTAKCHLLFNRYFHCHKNGLSPTLFSLLIKKGIFSHESLFESFRAPTHGDVSDWPVSYFNQAKQQL